MHAVSLEVKIQIKFMGFLHLLAIQRQWIDVRRKANPKCRHFMWQVKISRVKFEATFCASVTYEGENSLDSIFLMEFIEAMNIFFVFFFSFDDTFILIEVPSLCLSAQHQQQQYYHRQRHHHWQSWAANQFHFQTKSFATLFFIRQKTRNVINQLWCKKKGSWQNDFFSLEMSVEMSVLCFLMFFVDKIEFIIESFCFVSFDIPKKCVDFR